ncbi:unnamed protein product [Rotaria magnacalcarata]|uniref:Uncharacterized protein n=1 Tax=Rotaria magnacalcarata TaxID=392030 RepID=A0A816YTD1_9BILA|nr:unnamed protein product [Rotaria magnacalcarata]
MTVKFLCLIFSIHINSIHCAHFRGGAITWRPESNQISVLNTERNIIIEQRYAWSKTAAASACTTATILSFGTIGENAVSIIQCYSSAAACTGASYTTVSTFVPCTDYNTILGTSYGYSLTTRNLTVTSSGIVVGYVVSGAWLTLQLGAGGWDLMMYINMSPRSDNQLINSAPASNIPLVTYVPTGGTGPTSIDIPMSDADGDNIECRFGLTSNTLHGVVVDECGGVCQPVALPPSTQLISGNNTCTLIVSLPTVGYYAVAIQLEDFMENSTTPLSSVPLQFLLLVYDASNPVSTCTVPPIITSIPPDFPAEGATITVQVNFPYEAMVIAQTGCPSDPDLSISNFITSSPPGMLKSNLPFVLVAPSYAINLTWTPTINQLNQTYQFCAVAIDIDYHLSSQYCFFIFVGPQTTTTTTTSTTTTTTTSTTTTTTTSTTTTTTSTTTSTTSTTSTSSTSTTTTSETTSTSTSTTTTTITPDVSECNCIPLVMATSLGLGIPLFLLLGLISLLYLFRCCPGPLRSIIHRRFFQDHKFCCSNCRHSTFSDDSQDGNKSALPEGTRQYRQQYINTDNKTTTYRPVQSPVERVSFSANDWFNDRPISTVGFHSSMSRSRSIGSGSGANLLPNRRTSRITMISPINPPPQRSESLLLRLYSKQVHPQRAESTV